MYSIETLTITGRHYGDVPNTFFRQKGATGHLAIFLPGLGYTSHMPVMYYPFLAFLSRGIDVLRAEYNYVKLEDFMALPQDERRRQAAADATAIYATAIKQRRYDTVTFVGKSLGTVSMGHLITSVRSLPKLQCLWLTPVLKNELLLSQIKQVKHRALFVIGTADPYYDKGSLADLLRVTGGEGIVIEGADHSLEIDGDAIKSLQALERIMMGIEKFLG